jgi:murein L,D-transpeptidase YcbB/YkuD
VSTAADPAQAIRQFAPFAAQYRSLRRALALYRDNAARGGWEPIAAGQTIKPGMSDPRVPSIRKRLAASGDLPPALAESRDERYDEATRLAMESLQRRYGLDADGVVGKMSLAAMNVPAAERVEQISLNMERWRRYTEDLDSTQIVVNLAGFDLTVFEKGQDVLRMPVAVGRPFRRTPIFNGLMTYLEFSPTWTVPPTILKEDILPKLRNDPAYLATKGIEVYESWQPNASKLIPETVDWRGLGPAAQAYRFVQPPGPQNALGGVKFMFPNEHSIYLHDTPDRGIFAKASRAFSSGCIRVQRPAELAAYLLKGQGNWDLAAVREAMNQTAPQRVNLASPVTVRITYSTVWVGDGGDVNFRDDVYGRDATLREMLLSSSQAH